MEGRESDRGWIRGLRRRGLHVCVCCATVEQRFKLLSNSFSGGPGEKLLPLANKNSLSLICRRTPHFFWSLALLLKVSLSESTKQITVYFDLCFAHTAGTS